MGRWKHRLSNLNVKNKRADCLECGKEIRVVWNICRWRCNIGKREKDYSNHDNHIYRKNFIQSLDVKKCSKCEIENTDIRFFDVNHKDGNGDNHKKGNLELLCPNCHRIETIRQWKNNEIVKWKRNYKFLS